MIKRTLLCLLMVVSCIGAEADIVKGRVLDAQTKEPLEGATVTFEQRDGDSYWMNSTYTDSLGRFTVWAESMRTTIKASFIGYYDKSKRIVCQEGRDTTQLEDILLVPNEIMLKNVDVTAHAKRFTLRGDTVVFHPEAFHLQEGEQLENLIEKLPGVTKKDGKLYWNGRPVRLNMHGNNVLSPELMGKLPAEAVKEIKGYDKKSEFTDRTGQDDGNDEQVLDVVIKPGFLDNWYGGLSVAGLTSGNYEGTLNAHYLSENNPVMTFVRLSDDDKRMEPMGGGSIAIMSGGAPCRQQLGALSYRHQWNPKFEGWKRPNNWEILAVPSHNDVRADDENHTETFVDGASSTFSVERSDSYKHEQVAPISFIWNLNLTPMTKLYLTTDADYTHSLKTSHSEQETSIGEEYDVAVNNSSTSSTEKTDRKHGKLYAELTHYVQKNEFILVGSLDYTDGTTDYDETGVYNYLQQSAYLNDYQQFADKHHNINGHIAVSADMWLNNQLELKLRLHHGYDNNYKRENRMRNGEEDLANSMERDSRTNNEIFMLSGVWNVGTWSFRPEMELDWQHEKTDYLRGKLDTVATRNNLLPAPSFNLQWKPNKKNTLRASVNYKAKLPDIISTLNYHDDTNPLSIIEGNTNLKRSGSLSADINYVLSNPKYEQMFSLTMKYGSEYDPVSSVSYYNTATGVYRTHQENTRGGNSLSLNIGYDRALSDRWELQNMLELSTGDTYGILTIIEGSVQRTITQQRLTEIQYRPTLKYQYNNWKFTVAGKGIMRHNKYDNGQVDAFTLYYYNLKTNAEYTIGNFTFQLSPWFEGRKGYNTPRFNRDNLILDAAAWYKFGKNKWTARLDLNDIFNRALNNYANETGTSRYETQSRFMHHFIKFSLEYRFDAKGKKK